MKLLRSKENPSIASWDLATSDVHPNPFDEEKGESRMIARHIHTNTVTGVKSVGESTRESPLRYIVDAALIREVRAGRWVTGMIEAICDELERLRKGESR